MSTRKQKGSRPQKSGKTKKTRRSTPKKASSSSLAISGPPVSQSAWMPKLYTNVTSISHRSHGDGIRISGCMLVGNIIQTTGSFIAFNDYGAAGTGNHYLYLHPSLLAAPGTRFTQLCHTYQRYGFRRVKLLVVPEVSTSTAGLFGVAYHQDPAEVIQPVDVSTFSRVVESGDMMLGQSWRPCEHDFTRQLDKDFLGWVDSTSETDYSSKRIQVQGGFIFSQKQNTWTSTVETGAVVMEYVVELFQPARFINVTTLLDGKESKEKKSSSVYSRSTNEIPIAPPARPSPSPVMELLQRINARLERLERLGVPEGETS